MDSILDYDRLVIDYKMAHCLNRCIFCHSSDEYRKATLVTFAKLQSIVEKLLNWKEQHGLVNFKMFIGAATWDHQYIKEVIKLDQLIHNSTEGYEVMLGGMGHRPEPEMRKWLTYIKKAGAESVGMTFWGPPKMHDAWCGREGEYDFIMMATKLAPEIGLTRLERLFLTKSSLPHLNSIMDILDDIPGPKKRAIFPLNYLGRAVNLEYERLTQEEFAALPNRIYKELRNKDLRTEAEWMKFVKHEWDGSKVAKVMRFQIDKTNVDKLAAMNAEQIMEWLHIKHEQLYQALPDFHKISEQYGNPASNKIYSLYDVETLWSYCYYQENPQRNLPELKERLFFSLKKIVDYPKVIEALKILDELDFQLFSLFPC